MIFQVAALFARAFIEGRLVESGETRAFAHGVGYLVAAPLLFVLLFPVLRKFATALHSLLRVQDLTLRLVFVSIFLGLSLRASYWGVLISSAAFGIIQSGDPNAVTGPNISFGCPTAGVLAVSVLAMSFLVPVIEESINRGLILQSLLYRGRACALFASSVLFALLHDPESMAPAFFAGLFLGTLMLNCKNLWGPLISHASYNSIGILDWQCMTTQWNPPGVTTTTIGVGLLAGSLAVMGLGISCLLVQKRFIGAPGAPR